MNDLYIITILGNLGGLVIIVGLLCWLAGVALYICATIEADGYLTQEEKEAQRHNKKKAYKLLIIGFIAILINCFIPNTKEMYAIYGIGGVIDYIKSNEKAKKLPDKVIDALDKYLDEQKNET